MITRLMPVVLKRFYHMLKLISRNIKGLSKYQVIKTKFTFKKIFNTLT